MNIEQVINTTEKYKTAMMGENGNLYKGRQTI